MFTQTTLKGLVWNYTWTAEHDGKNREEICRPFIKDGVFSPHRSNRIVTFLLPIIYCFTKSLIIRNNHFSASSFPWHTASKWNKSSCILAFVTPDVLPLHCIPTVTSCWFLHACSIEKVISIDLPFQASFNMIHIHLWISTFPCCPDISAINTLKSSPWKDMKCYKGK